MLLLFSSSQQHSFALTPTGRVRTALPIGLTAKFSSATPVVTWGCMSPGKKFCRSKTMVKWREKYSAVFWTPEEQLKAVIQVEGWNNKQTNNRQTPEVDLSVLNRKLCHKKAANYQATSADLAWRDHCFAHLESKTCNSIVYWYSKNSRQKNVLIFFLFHFSGAEEHWNNKPTSGETVVMAPTKNEHSSLCPFSTAVHSSSTVCFYLPVRVLKLQRKSKSVSC